MTPRDIIARAWAITLRCKALRRWSFVAAFLETCLDVTLVAFQSSFLITYIRTGDITGFFDVTEALFSALPGWLFGTFVITGILLFLCEFFLPHLCRGAVIGLGAKAHLGEPVRGGLILALYNFFPLFALHGFVILSSWTTTTSAASLIVRYFQEPMRSLSIGMLIILFLFMSLLKFLFGFAPQAVVVKKMGVFPAIARSIKLIISNISQVMFLVLLLLVISIRILINAVLVILIPAFMVGIGLFLALFLSPTLSTIIALSVGLVLLITASYFFAYLYAFKLTVWTIAFMELDGQKDLDIIE